MTGVTIALLLLVLALVVGLGVAACDDPADYGLIDPVSFEKGEHHD